MTGTCCAGEALMAAVVPRGVDLRPVRLTRKTDTSPPGRRINRRRTTFSSAEPVVALRKLAGIGRLAAGMPRGGNPLGALGTFVEVLRRRGAEPEVVRGMAEELKRIDAIIRSLLAYARPQEEELQAVEPAAVVRDTFALLQAQGALKAVRPELDVGDSLPMIRGRALLLQQALVNLMLNAVTRAGGGV